MSEKKKLVINCAVADLTETSQETVDQYESITVNAAQVLCTPASNARLGAAGVLFNAASVYEMPSDTPGNITVSAQNGNFTIAKDSPAPEKPTFLCINGKLTVETGAESALRGYVGGTVNGMVICPKSMTGLLSGFTVNGKILPYPDGAVLLKKHTAIDRTFILRAADALYYAEKTLVLIAADLDISALVHKGARFSSKTAVIAESYLEAAIPLFDMDTEIVAVPDGCAYVDGDLTLSDQALRRYGDKLYVQGDMTASKDALEAVQKLRFLHVAGDVRAEAACADALCQIGAAYENLHIFHGRIFSERLSLTVDAHFAAQNPDGATFAECVDIRVKEDTPIEWLRGHVAFSECVNISCANEEQRAAIEDVAEECVSIRIAGEKKSSVGGAVMDAIKDAVAGAGESGGEKPSLLSVLKDTRVINATFYKLR